MCALLSFRRWTPFPRRRTRRSSSHCPSISSRISSRPTTTRRRKSTKARGKRRRTRTRTHDWVQVHASLSLVFSYQMQMYIWTVLNSPYSTFRIIRAQIFISGRLTSRVPTASDVATGKLCDPTPSPPNVWLSFHPLHRQRDKLCSSWSTAALSSYLNGVKYLNGRKMVSMKMRWVRGRQEEE